MRIELAILRHVEMPLRFRFRTSFGETTIKRFLLLELRSGGLVGWGECVAEEDPFYASETIATAREVLLRYLLPLTVGREIPDPEAFELSAARVRGHRMAKATIETALCDLFAKAAGQPLSRWLGGVRSEIEVGVSLGIAPTVRELIANVRKHVEQGYRRIKLKIEPGLDRERLAAVREEFGAIVLTADANGAYSLKDEDLLLALDPFGLDYIEQPLHFEDLLDHAQLAAKMKTPVCLDESIRSAADARAAIKLSACRVLNVKIGRVGGHREARRIHDVASSMNVPLWCGGMLEAGVGRAHNIAIASLPGFSKPGDTSSASRYFEEDIVEPSLEARNGVMPVPTGVGIGVQVRHDVLARVTTELLELKP